ncbi:MAG: RagB/SusD family nutrient uptake outer membrane protein [Bacteroidales bacterium]
MTIFQYLKTGFRIRLLPFAALLMLFSCSDFLDVDEQTRISNDKLFSTVEGNAEALSSAYYMLGEANYYGRNMMVVPGIKGGNLKIHDIDNSNPMSFYFRPSYEFNHSEDPEDDYTDDIYRKIYEVIMTVNNIIEYAPDIGDASEEEKNQILAEARAIRALAHFDLTRLFAQPYIYSDNAQHPGVAYIDRVLGYNEHFGRDRLYQNYNRILEDLAFAEEHIGTSLARDYASGAMDYYSSAYFSKRSVQALMARVYLYKGDWSSAREYASEVISTGGASLQPHDAFVERFVSNDPSGEDLFIINNEGSSSGAPLASIMGTRDDRNTNYLEISNDLLSLFDEKDRRLDYYIHENDGMVSLKYPEFDGNKDHYIPMIRLAEMYLIRAEASVNLPNPDEVQARSDLNKIRRRANPDAPGINLTGEALREEIFLERRRELALEGHLFFDIARQGRNVRREDVNATMNRNLDYGDYRYVLPIPQRAVSLNDQMTQNEGY